VEYSIWGEEADQFAGNQADVMAIKGARVSDYNTRSLSGGIIAINPEIQEAANLLGWYEENSTIDFSSVSVSSFRGGETSDNAKGVTKIQDAREQFTTLNEDQTVRMSHVCVFSSIPTEGKPLFYQGCPNCRKKVTEVGDGIFSCPKCGDVSGCVHRFIFSGMLMDNTGSMWASLFGEQGESVFGVSADTLAALKAEVRFIIFSPVCILRNLFLFLFFFLLRIMKLK
jgi:replication factor A1